ncbi:MAG: hypothetical protein COX81_00725 [Candidatus Magasanikbacteria bacterium CG_4_10_14_0_2_um_filter_37_12]|uniref:Carbohydrate kinase PfkB domain-containing protein n=1 Tax=Candidatus Magasanikbacteria bacterium CG_4_10_14_0_2_um_filter_37_12 TaxID=1974637 RepID=A0A2M7V9N6_9BACT|nr:MAG: hypothetical protein COX81_00725 [Candidatus Magasanikbacteria bacterium CG_4_10_14_0_2_um_filter_37_12]
MFDLITIGDSLVDIFFVLDEKNSDCIVDLKNKKICFGYADKMSIEHSTHSVGGNAANVAVGTQKLGITTAILTEIGDDINGQIIFDALQKAKVDTNLIKVQENQETRYSVVLNYQSERTILSYHAKRSYTLPNLPDTDWIYYTSLGKSFEKLQNKLVDHLKKNQKIKLAMNPGSYQFKNGLKKIKEILPLVDLLFLNKEEAEKMVGKRKDIISLLKEILRTGVKKTVLTDSTTGSYSSDGTNFYSMSSYPIKSLAKTGAGDAYTSGFLSATILGKNITEAMQWGTANASGVIQKFGAEEGLLGIRQIQKIIKEYPKITPKHIT